MSDEMTFTLVLTGGRAGKTCICGKFQFTKGELTIRGDSKGVGGVSRYLGRTYGAFPKGSIALAKAQEADRGNPSLNKDSGSGQPVEVPSELQPDGSTNENPTSLDGTIGGGDTTIEHLPEGDGHQHTRINEALTKLNHEDDEHWTQGGKPAVHAVSQFLEEPVNRDDITAAAPDFKRER